MTIKLTTPMIGPVDSDAATITPPFRGHAYDDATVDAFAAALIKWTGVFGLRTSIIAAQIAKETGYFRFGGQVQPDQFNLAGLGSTNDGAAGLRYPDIGTGVCAVCAHHMVYIHGNVQNWPPDLQRYVSLDQRYAAVISTGRAGSIHVLGDYTNGNWAYTASIPIGSLANGYATGIVIIANTFTKGESPVSNEPTEGDIGFPTRTHWAGDVGPERAMGDIRWFVVHDTEGHFAGDESVLTQTGNPVESAHFLISEEGETVYMVPLTSTAWTPGNDPVARASINVEQSGFATRPYTDAQYRAMASIFNWCVAQGMTGVPAVYIGRQDADGGPEPDVAGILGHQDVPNPYGAGWGGAAGHTDPGPLYDWARLIQYIKEGQGQPAPAPGYRDDVTGKLVANAMLDYFNDNGGIALIGRPLTEEIDAPWPDDPDGSPPRRQQVCEREVLGFFPENEGKARVQALRLGARYARSLGLHGVGIDN